MGLNGVIPPAPNTGYDRETEEKVYNKLNAAVNGYYITQKTRISTGNILAGNFRQTVLDTAPGEKVDEEKLEKEKKKLLDKVRSDYKMITAGIAAEVVVSMSSRNFTKAMNNVEEPLEVISSEEEFRLANNFMNLVAAEAAAEKNLKSMVENTMMWNWYFSQNPDMKGIGHTIAGIILSSFDIHKAPYVSSLLRYAGLITAKDGRGISARKDHLVEKEYVDKNGSIKTKMSLDYNKRVQSKLLTLVPAGLRKGKNQVYVPIMDAYKHRLKIDPARQCKFVRKDKDTYGIVWEQDCNQFVNFADGEWNKVPRIGGKFYPHDPSNGIWVHPENRKQMINNNVDELPVFPLGRIEAMTKRYAVKIVLTDLYFNWKRFCNLKWFLPWNADKLGHKRHFRIMHEGKLQVVDDFHPEMIADPTIPLVGVH